jgi:hypothetical protein
VTDKPPPLDPARRTFIRQLAGDVVTSMGSMLGAAQLLQAESMEAAKGLLDPGGPGGSGSSTGGSPIAPEVSAVNAGYRAPFRWDEDVIHVVDQRRLPDILADLQVHGAADAVTAINDGALVGAQVQAQVAAATLALIAAKSGSSRGFARRASLRGAAHAFRQARPGSAPMALALDRMLALLEELGTDTDATELVAALKAEAEAIIAEATADHGMVVTHGIGVLSTPSCRRGGPGWKEAALRRGSSSRRACRTRSSPMPPPRRASPRTRCRPCSRAPTASPRTAR